MNQVTITIKTTNGAFADGNLHAEIARILGDLSSKFENGQEPASVNDINGNKVAKISYE